MFINANDYRLLPSSLRGQNAKRLIFMKKKNYRAM
jgi:hypothetical protein